MLLKRTKYTVFSRVLISQYGESYDATLSVAEVSTPFLKRNRKEKNFKLRKSPEEIPGWINILRKGR